MGKLSKKTIKLQISYLQKLFFKYILYFCVLVLMKFIAYDIQSVLIGTK